MLEAILSISLYPTAAIPMQSGNLGSQSSAFGIDKGIALL